MEKKEEILKRYYRGETTIAEERELKKAWQQGELPEEPILGLQKIRPAFPPALTEDLQRHIQCRHRHKIRQIRMVTGSVAALFILFFSLRELLPASQYAPLQLSDNLKKERFENALRVIGSALEEKKFPAQKILYEDHNLIIAVE